MMNDEMFVLEGEMNKMLSLLKKTFYSNEEIFLRELINNASDALDRIQFERLSHRNILDDGLSIRLVPHKGNKTLSIMDNGIGMTEADLAYNLGVGFYSAYLVAHKVVVTTKHNDHDQYIWESQSGASFNITKDIKAQQPSRGTNITLYLNDNQLEYLEDTIIYLVVKNCQHISHPIYLWTENSKDHWLCINIWLHNQERDTKFVSQKLMNHVPDDLVFSIISNLPLKSLKRFGCIQRSWTLLFENSHFMNLFRNNFICNHHSYYDDTSLILCTVVPQPFNIKSTLFSISGEKFQNMEKLNFPDQFQEDYPNGYGILGSINGILCLHQLDNGKLAYLWNPTTNELKVIPPSPVESVPPSVYQTIMFHGFGYDCDKDDYKVIRIVGYIPVTDYEDEDPDSAVDFFSIPQQWEMYSLRSNCWKKLEKLDYYGLPTLYDEFNEKLYFEGMCHWLGYKEGPSQSHLVSFDLKNEVCITKLAPIDVPMNDNFNGNFVRKNLLLLNGSIALMSSFYSDSTFYISILGEVGNKETWTKLFVFGPIPYIAFSVGAANLGNILFQTYDGDLAWFDLSTHIVQKLGVKVEGGFGQLVVYKKSLLPIETINS